MQITNKLLMGGFTVLILATGCGTQTLPKQTITPSEIAAPTSPVIPGDLTAPVDLVDPVPPEVPVTPEASALTVALLHERMEFGTQNPSQVSLPWESNFSNLNARMTLEAFVAPTELPTAMKAKSPFISKGTAELTDWEFGISLVGTRTKLYFTGRVGTEFVTVYSAPISNEEMPNFLAGFQHVAVTWDHGIVQFYYNGIPFGVPASIGEAGAAILEESFGDIFIGRNNQHEAFTGMIAELRISQVARWNGAFEVPVEPYLAD